MWGFQSYTDPGNPEYERLIRDREFGLNRMLRQMAMSTVVRSQAPMIDPVTAFDVAGPLMRNDPAEQERQFVEAQKVGYRDLPELIGAAKAHGIADAERWNPEELAAALAEKRKAPDEELRQRLRQITEVWGDRAMQGVGALDAMVEAAQRVPWAGDWLAKRKSVQKSEEWLARVEEGLRIGMGETAGVAKGIGGVIGYAVPATAAWKLAGLGGAFTEAGLIGSRLTPFGRMALRGAAAEWMIEGGGDAPLQERALNIALGAAFTGGSELRGLTGGLVSGVGVGAIAGGIMSEGDPSAMLLGGVAGAAGMGTMRLFLDRARRSFPSRFSDDDIPEAEWEWDDGTAGSINPPPRPQLPPGPKGLLAAGDDADYVVLDNSYVPAINEIPQVADIVPTPEEAQMGLRLMKPTALENTIARLSETETYAAVAPGVIKSELGFHVLQPLQDAPIHAMTSFGQPQQPSSFEVEDTKMTAFLEQTKLPKIAHFTPYVFEKYNLDFAGALETSIDDPNADATFVVPGIYGVETDRQSADLAMSMVGAGKGSMDQAYHAQKDLDFWNDQMAQLLKNPNKLPSNFMSWAVQHSSDPKDYAKIVMEQIEKQQKVVAKSMKKAGNAHYYQPYSVKPLDFSAPVDPNEAFMVFDKAVQIGLADPTYLPSWYVDKNTPAGSYGAPFNGYEMWRQLRKIAGGKVGTKKVLEAAGYDAIKYWGEDVGDGAMKAMVVFHPKQLFSAFHPLGNSQLMGMEPYQAVPGQAPLAPVNNPDPFLYPAKPGTGPQAPGMAQDYWGKNYPLGDPAKPLMPFQALESINNGGLPWPPDEYGVPQDFHHWDIEKTVKAPLPPGALNPVEAMVEATQLSKHAAIMESPALAEISTVHKYDDADVAWSVVDSNPGQVAVVKNVGDLATTIQRILTDQMPNGVGPSDFRVVAMGGLPQAKPVYLDPDNVMNGGIIKTNMGGSNNAQMWKGIDGSKWVIKKYADSSRTGTENIANAIYRALKIPVPETGIVEDPDGIFHVSKVVTEDGKSAELGELLNWNDPYSKVYAYNVLDGFAADVLLANWDAAGLDLDNIMMGDDGRIYRIDNGGALLYRGMGQRKPDHLLDEITEWDFFAKGNPEYSKIFAKVGIESADQIPAIVEQIEDIMKLSRQPGGWRAMVDQFGDTLSPADKDRVVQMLEARAEKLWEIGNRIKLEQNAKYQTALTFTKDHLPVPEVNGIRVSYMDPPADWNAAPGLNMTLREGPIRGAGNKKISTGIIAMEPDGSLWMVEPTNHFGGYENTFPKGGLEEGLSMQANALKEAFEETGMQFAIKDLVGDFEKSTSVTRYYLAVRTGGDPREAQWETQAVKLVPPGLAKELLNTQVDKEIAEVVYRNFSPEVMMKPVKSMPAMNRNPVTYDLMVSSGAPITDQMVKEYQEFGMFTGQKATYAATGQEVIIQGFTDYGQVRVKPTHGTTQLTLSPLDLAPSNAANRVDDAPEVYAQFQAYAQGVLDWETGAAGVDGLSIYSNDAASQIPLLMDSFVENYGGGAIHKATLRQIVEKHHIEALRELAPPEEKFAARVIKSEFEKLLDDTSFPLPPPTTKDFAASKGFEWRPDERTLVDALSDGKLVIPVDSEQSAIEFLMNFSRELVDDAPVSDFPQEVIDTPLGYSETMGRDPGQWDSGERLEDALEMQVGLMERYLGGGGDGGGGGGEPPFGGGFFEDGPPLLGPGEGLAGEFKAAHRRDPRRYNDLRLKAASIVSRMFMPVRNLVMMFDNHLQRLGVQGGNFYGMVAELQNAHTRHMNRSSAWKDRAFEAIMPVRSRLVRDGSLWEAINASGEDRIRIMQEAGFKPEERQAVADWDAIMREFYENEATRAFPDMGRIDNYISHMRKFEASLPGEERFNPAEADWGPEKRRDEGDESSVLEKDVSVLIPRYFDSFFKYVEMDAPYRALKEKIKQIPKEGEASLAPVRNALARWIDARMWGLDPTHDIAAGAMHWVLDKGGSAFGIRFTMDDVMKLAYTGFRMNYGQALGFQISPLVRDLPQMLIGGMHIGLDKTFGVMKQFARDANYAREVAERAVQYGWVGRGHSMHIDADVTGSGQWRTPEMQQNFGPEAAANRERLAGVGDFIQDKVAKPLGLGGGMQGTWADPLTMYSKLGDYARAVLGEVGYQTANAALREYAQASQGLGGEALAALRKKLLRDSRVGRFQGPIQDTFMEYVERGDFDGAAAFFGNESANSQNIYGMSAQPLEYQRWGPLTGRIAMRWKTFTTQTLANNAQIFNDKRITPEAKMAYAMQVAALQTLFVGATAITGWNFSRMALHGAAASIFGSTMFDYMNDMQRADAALREGVGENLTPDQSALLGSGASNFGSTPFTLDPTRSSLNPWAGAFRTVAGIGQTMQWGPEAVGRFLTTGQRGDPYLERMQRTGQAPGLLPIPPAPGGHQGPFAAPFATPGEIPQPRQTPWTGGMPPNSAQGGGAMY